MGFEKVFDNLTFKRMDALRETMLSLVHYVLKYYFRIHDAILSRF